MTISLVGLGLAVGWLVVRTIAALRRRRTTPLRGVGVRLSEHQAVRIARAVQRARRRT